MMIALPLALCQDASGPEIVSKMIAKLNSAQKVSGDFYSTVKIGEETITISSKLQIERPSKFYLNQVVTPGNKRYLVTSDGKEFSYPRPYGDDSVDLRIIRLVEPVTGTTTLGDIYHACGQSLAERSAVLDLAVSNLEDLKMLRSQWQTMEKTGQVDLDGVKVNRIVGKWRLNALSESTANYGIFVTDSGDLKKYVIDGDFEPDAKSTVHVTREFKIDLRIDAELDEGLFKVVRG